MAAILNSIYPLFTMVMAHLVLSDDRMTRNRLMALLKGLLEIVILMGRDGRSALSGGERRTISVLIG